MKYKYDDGRFNPGDIIKLKDDCKTVFRDIDKDKGYMVHSTSRAGKMLHIILNSPHNDGDLGNYENVYFEIDKQHIRGIKLNQLGI